MRSIRSSLALMRARISQLSLHWRIDAGQLWGQLVALGQGGLVGRSTARLFLLRFDLAQALSEPSHGLLHAVVFESGFLHLTPGRGYVGGTEGRIKRLRSRHLSCLRGSMQASAIPG